MVSILSLLRQFRQVNNARVPNVGSGNGLVLWSVVIWRTLYLKKNRSYYLKEKQQHDSHQKPDLVYATGKTSGDYILSHIIKIASMKNTQNRIITVIM